MRPDLSLPRQAAAKSVALLSVAVSWLATAAQTSAISLLRQVLTVGTLTRSSAQTLFQRARRLFEGPVRRVVAGPIRTGLFGRRIDVSILVTLLAPVLALATAWWLGSTVGYETLEQWIRGTWYGTSPSAFVFLAAALLVALGAVSAGVNSGLVPTALLVAAPTFGAAVTRYGTEVTYSWGTKVVSLPNAVGVAAVLALAFGVPFAVGGFLVGTAIRRLVAVFDRGSGPASSPGNV
jgi:hypothetical protein